jgi:heme exporter protein CcmD
MSDFLSMGGNGAYVWSAYGITLGVLIWNALSARYRLRKNLAEAQQTAVAEEPARRPRVSQVEDD